MNQGFILTKNSKDKGRKSEISLWVKTKEGAVNLLISGEPYVCFVLREDSLRLKQVASAANLSVEIKEVALKNFAYQDVDACYLPTFALQKKLTELALLEDIKLFETDLRLTDRYLMERFICGGLDFIGTVQHYPAYQVYSQVKIKAADVTPVFSQVSLDIECSENGVLYSVGLDSLMDSRVIMVGEPQNTSRVITWVANEKALIEELVCWFQRFDPDLIIGWNLVDFDMQLLVKRAAVHNIRFAIGRGNSVPLWRDARDGMRGFLVLEGRVALDGISALKNAGYSFTSWSLESVSQKLLGEGKAIENPYDRMDHINRMFASDKCALAKYNLQDSRLVTRIFAKTHLLDFLIERVKLTGLDLDRSGGSVAAFYNLYMPRMHRSGFVAPDFKTSDWIASPGGYVMESRPDLYRSVLVLDFKSLYPSIIRTFQIDPVGLIEGLHLHQQDPEHPHLIPGFRGAFFHREKHILPDMIENLWQARDRAKNDGEQAFSQAIKIIMNSFYGVLGAAGCCFFDYRLASSITMRGHEILKTTKEVVQKSGYEVIYGDTDSIFVWLKEEKTQDQADKIGNELVQIVNDFWRKELKDKYRIDSALEIEYETHYLRFHMPKVRNQEQGSKKRYAGLIKNDQLVFKGLESVRSDWTDLAQEFQRGVYERVFHDKPVEKYIEHLVEEVRTGKHDQALVYRKRIRRSLREYMKNIPPQIKAARLADEHNAKHGRPQQYQNGGWISYLITVQGPQPLECVDAPIDYEHYVEKQLKPIADSILPYLGLNFDDFTQPQMGLF